MCFFFILVGQLRGMIFSHVRAYEYNAWVYQNRLYFFLFTSYLMHYLIPGLPVHNSL